MVPQFKEAIARRPDGISIMGHPGEAALGPLVDEARAAGIIVTTSNVDLPTYEAKYKGADVEVDAAQHVNAADGFLDAAQRQQRTGIGCGFGHCLHKMSGRTGGGAPASPPLSRSAGSFRRPSPPPLP